MPTPGAGRLSAKRSFRNVQPHTGARCELRGCVLQAVLFIGRDTAILKGSRSGLGKFSFFGNFDLLCAPEYAATVCRTIIQTTVLRGFQRDVVKKQRQTWRICYCVRKYFSTFYRILRYVEKISEIAPKVSRNQAVSPDCQEPVNTRVRVVLPGKSKGNVGKVLTACEKNAVLR
ncbi:hypothetical protein [Robbsia andropogonis]|uniref:hypothetical protein n=1 Tax=Robbsia andropogonis TaxID=28092 RepID=UPI000ABC8C2F|nr:hypothetical protein [Robbsia andropogonis]MCP1118729.1 hypothetical protein [Robbsia andropogonis]MCP1128196.1 hypothetical protein [Robbsia andropogonis]